MNKLMFGIIILRVVAETEHKEVFKGVIILHNKLCGTVEGNTNNIYNFTGNSIVYFHLIRTSPLYPNDLTSAEMCLWTTRPSIEKTLMINICVARQSKNLRAELKTYHNMIAVIGASSQYISYSYCIEYCGATECPDICPNECSSRGSCDIIEKKCTCDSGYTGSQCDKKKEEPKKSGVAWYVYVIPIVVVAFIIIAVMAIGISNGMIKPRRYLGYYTEQAPLIPPKLTIFIVKTTEQI